ncbi:MAG: PDZ domain-containing protein, partial [Chthoniobacterales bacterium]
GCYILPINAAEKTRNDFTRFHELKPGWVGISVEPVTGTSLPSTARVSELQPSAPASSAGIRQGDILLSVGDIAIHAPDDIFDASFFLTAGDETNVTVLRGGKEQKFTIRAAEIPSASDVAQSLTLPDNLILSLDNSASSPKPSP